LNKSKIRITAYERDRSPRWPGYWVSVWPDLAWRPDRISTGFSADEMQKIADWCASHGGTRRSFDQWSFDNEANVTLFILRWDGQDLEQ